MIISNLVSIFIIGADRVRPGGWAMHDCVANQDISVSRRIHTPSGTCAIAIFARLIKKKEKKRLVRACRTNIHPERERLKMSCIHYSRDHTFTVVSRKRELSHEIKNRMSYPARQWVCASIIYSKLCHLIVWLTLCWFAIINDAYT